MTDEQERRKIAREAAQETVDYTFKLLGIDITTEKGRHEFRETIEWVKRMRELSNSSTRAFVWIVLTTVIGGFALALWEGIKTLAHR